MRRVLLIMFFSVSAIFASEIVVYGESNLKIIPDSAVVRLQIFTDGSDLQDAKNKNDEMAKKLKNILKQKEISTKQIQIDNVYIYARDRYSKDGEITGKIYEATKGVRIYLKGLENSGEILSEILTLGINNAEISYESSKHQENINLTLKDAIDIAHQKANSIAKSLDLKISGVKSIEEIPNSYNPSPIMLKNSYSENSLYGMISVSSSVKITYEAN
ncbi:MAG: SIMPL domain-containing protein [Campylobacter sp.]|nr:SIMPL domain-containing protein [Campylobacter sp.]